MSNATFFCGIGGSGMLPLAAIVRASGARVSGSDRALDAGRLAPKFDYLKSLGIVLAPQDGSGLVAGKTLVTSAAVGWEKLVNRQGTTWRKLDSTVQADLRDAASARALMLEQPSVIKRPVVQWHAGHVTVGFDPVAFTAALPNSNVRR